MPQLRERPAREVLRRPRCLLAPERLGLAVLAQEEQAEYVLELRITFFQENGILR